MSNSEAVTEKRRKKWRDWWKRNKAEQNRLRREKWRKDPAFRKAQLARVTTRNSILTAMKTEQRTRTTHDGRLEKLYYLCQMEPLVGRDVFTLRRWRTQGERIFPKALYYDKRGRGMYSESQVKFIAELLGMVERDEVFLTYRFMGQTLTEVWGRRFSRTSLKAALVNVPRKYRDQNNAEDKEDGTYVARRSKRQQKYREIFSGKRKLRAPRTGRSAKGQNHKDR